MSSSSLSPLPLGLGPAPPARAITLTRHCLKNLMGRRDGDGPELVSLLVSLQSVLKNISAAVRRAGIAKLFGSDGSINVQGEEQQKLDVIANRQELELETSNF